MTTRRTRPGVSLTEVLIAIFVMAIGMMALLTLFPLGAMQMAQKFKDDRTSQTASQAEGFLRTYWRYSIVPPAGAGQLRDEPLIQSFVKPNDPPPAPFNALPYASPFYPRQYANASYLAPVGNEPSYPVMIDPLGLFARIGAVEDQFWVGKNTPGAPIPLNVPLLPRRNLSLAVFLINNDFQNSAIQTCCMTDDITFGANGQPPDGQLQRQGRYTWAAIVQRPDNSVPNVADLTILVFDARPPLLAAPGDEVVVETMLTPGDRSVAINVPTRSTDQVPLVRKGGWIMDGTLDPTTKTRHARFYRIAGVTEGTPDLVAGTTPFVLDLDSNVKRADGGTAAYPAKIYLFAGLSEVFERPQLRPDAQ